MKRIKIPVYEPWIDDEEKRILNKVVEEKWISSKGPYVKQFEKYFSEWLGIKNSISCSNGTAALHLALLSLQIGAGDEVIVPDLTFISTANAVKFTGAKPVFADVKLNTWNIDPEKIEDLITEKTKAIIGVHLYGNPIDFDPIKKIAKDHNLIIIEDVAEAIGATYKNKKTGTLGELGAFSFYGNKIITTGEGGMVVSNNKNLIEKALMLREHGMSFEKKYWHEVIGYNYRMTSLQAAIGIAQMKKLEKIIKKKKEIVKIYKDLIKEKNIDVIFQEETKSSESVWWMVSILVNEHQNRDKVINYLAEEGIETRPTFYPLTMMPPYTNASSERENVNSYKIGLHGINLPSGPLLTHEEIELVVKTLKKAIK